ncbi:hypothetical protein [Antrihabitans cavernicola]|nr:hypothetical protein [Spelaeibacter cavernicola]
MNETSLGRAIPAFFVGVGVVCLVSAVVGGRPIVGVVMLVIMAACGGALFLLRRRSETYTGLTDEPDERFNAIGQRALAGTGAVLTIALFGALVGDLASGGTGSPFFWLLATGAVTFVALVALLRRQS